MEPIPPSPTGIIDNFLPKKDLVYWQTRITEATISGTPFNPEREYLFEKINELIGLVFVGARLYRIPPEIPANPHQDSNQYAVIFYPFDNDGKVAIYTDDHKLAYTIDIKSNRLILLDCANQIHSQIAGHSTRYSVVFKYRPSQ